MKPTSPSPRVQRNRDAAMQAILEAARAIMREEGVAALSMQELARRMEMRAPSLYNYFSGKMDIYDALFRLGITLYDRHLEELQKNASTLREEIQIALESYMTFALKNPDLYQLCFERPVPGFVPSDESLALSVGVLSKAHTRMDALKPQLGTRLTSQQIVDLIIAVAHGLTAQHLANEPQRTIGEGRFGSLIPAATSMIEANLLVKGAK